MRPELQPFATWIGGWSGAGKTYQGIEVRVNLRVRPLFDGEALEFDADVFHEPSGQYVSGGCSLLGVGQDGVLRMTTFASSFGVVLQVDEGDDEGTLALVGVRADGSDFHVTMVEEEGELHLLTSWNRGYLPTDPDNRSFLKLRRMKAIVPNA